MKQIQKERRVYDTVWQACDGTEFKNRDDCENYESSYKGVIKARWMELIDGCEIRSCDVDIVDRSYDACYYKFVPKSESEIQILNMYGATVWSGQYDNIQASRMKVGEKYIIVEEECYMAIYNWTEKKNSLAEQLERLNKLMEDD